MTLTIWTTDEREALQLRKQGWKFKSMDRSLWTLEWPDAKAWPPNPKDVYK